MWDQGGVWAEEYGADGEFSVIGVEEVYGMLGPRGVYGVKGFRGCCRGIMVPGVYTACGKWIIGLQHFL